ncbi:hypothetical protein APTSU1_001666700 [Apodemus speciosus]|uniref:Uncharacterized protein n=1 Tax=Apodemus speciosus TaxID=105296 RepID=A0ABQ0FQC5_APOSI
MFTSLLERFCKKDSGPSQALEEPPVLESTSKEIPQTRKRGTENVPDIKQIFFREEEFEPHDEGSWEEYKSWGMASTMVGSYTAEVGDTDVEQQQEDLDSKENYPDAIEIQQWELRKVSSTIDPVADTLFEAPPASPEDDEYISIRWKKRKKWRRGLRSLVQLQGPLVAGSNGQNNRNKPLEEQTVALSPVKTSDINIIM